MSLKTKVYLAACLGAGLLLTGCETGPTPYQAKTDGVSSGYTDQQLAQNRYRVTYTGTSNTPRTTVENYLLFRAAQVTASAGFAAFAFDDRDTKSHTTYFTDDFGWFGPGRRHFGWWGGWPMDDEVETRPVTRYEAYAEIIMLTADQAKADPRSLNAQDVLNRLGPMVLPPPPPPPAPAGAHG